MAARDTIRWQICRVGKDIRLDLGLDLGPGSWFSEICTVFDTVHTVMIFSYSRDARAVRSSLFCARARAGPTGCLSVCLF
jgi:hypothetical protein